MDMCNLAANLGLTIREHHGPHRSGYDPDENIIHLRPGMPARFTRSVLAHEIGHHIHGHRPTHHGPARSRQERAANEWAARQLITPTSYAEVETLREGHTASMAHDLHVADELLLVYRSLLLRTDTTVYVAPKHGAGQYAHRLDA